MTTLSVTDAGELYLTLRGEEENRILTTMRRWPHWQRVVIERDPANAQRYLAITLMADAIHEPIVREILRRSFSMTFPINGGSCELALQEQTPHKTRGRR